MDYWNMAALANIQLCLLIMASPGPEGNPAWDELKVMYQKLWNKAGSPGKKMAEVEHLELLLDAFSLVNDQGLNQLVDFVGHLKIELENLVKAEALTNPY